MASVWANDLAFMTSLYPQIVSEIFEMSNVAYGLSLLDKFQKSSAVVATSQQLCFGDLVSENNRYKREVMMCLMGKSSIDIFIYCSYRLRCPKC